MSVTLLTAIAVFMFALRKPKVQRVVADSDPLAQGRPGKGTGGGSTASAAAAASASPSAGGA
jgi:hypothetical protein